MRGYGDSKFEKILFLVTRWRIMQTFKRFIFALFWRVFSVFAVLRSLWRGLFGEVSGMFLARVCFFGAKVGASFSRKDVAGSKGGKRAIFGSVGFNLVPRVFALGELNTLVWSGHVTRGFCVKWRIVY